MELSISCLRSAKYSIQSWPEHLLFFFLSKQQLYLTMSTLNAYPNMTNLEPLHNGGITVTLSNEEKHEAFPTRHTKNSRNPFMG